MNKRFQILVTVFGLGVFVYLVLDFGIENILTNIAKTGWWFLPIIAIWAVMYLCNALAWYVILGDTAGKISYGRIYALTVGGFALNYVTPLINLGGEPFRIIALRDHIGIRRSTASVILYNMVRVLSHFFFWLLAVGLILFFIPVAEDFRLLLGIVTVVVVVLILFFYAGHRSGVFRTLLAVCLKWRVLHPIGRRLQKREEALLEVDDKIKHLYNERRGAFYAALTLEFVARVIGSLEFYFIFLAVGLNLSFLHALYINAGSSLILNMFFFVPFELGTREGGLYLVMQSLGYPPGIGIFMGLANRVREFFWVLVGLILAHVAGRKEAGGALPAEEARSAMPALLFDFGGTLDTDGVHWSEKFWEAYQKHAPEITKEQFRDAYVDGEHHMTPEAIAHTDTLLSTLEKQVDFQFRALRTGGVVSAGGDGAEVPRKIARECYESVLETMQGVHGLLTHLRTRYRLGLVSNFYGNLDAVCRELGIGSLFDAIVDSEIVGVRKPDPAIFRIALETMHASPAEALVVGDSYDRDIVPAKALGCRTIWLQGKSWHTPDETGKADHVIRKLDDLSRVLTHL